MFIYYIIIRFRFYRTVQVQYNGFARVKDFRLPNQVLRSIRNGGMAIGIVRVSIRPKLGGGKCVGNMYDANGRAETLSDPALCRFAKRNHDPRIRR